MKYKEYDYIRGNTALNPNRKSKDYEVREKQPEKRVKHKVKTKQKKSVTKDVLKIASIAFVLGLVSVSIDGKLYKTQEELTKLNGRIKVEYDESEALKVDLIEKSSLGKIRSNAEKNMIIPKISDTVNVNMEKDNFSKTNENKSNKN